MMHFYKSELYYLQCTLDWIPSYGDKIEFYSTMKHESRFPTTLGFDYIIKNKEIFHVLQSYLF